MDVRKVLGGVDYLSAAQGNPGRRRYHLAPTALTDVELLDHPLDYIRRTADPADALAALRPALDPIEVPALRDGHKAAAYRVVDQVE